jgi:hypothetical protein
LCCNSILIRNGKYVNIVPLFLQNDKEDHRKAVFILCSPVFGTTKVILQDIIRNSNFEYCVLITSAHARVHQFSMYGGHREGIDDMYLFHKLEEEILEWMGNTVCKNVCVGSVSFSSGRTFQGSLFAKLIQFSFLYCNEITVRNLAFIFVIIRTIHMYILCNDV